MNSFVDQFAAEDRIESVDRLLELYNAPVEAAILKERDHISDHYRPFIELSPFVVVATSGKDGLDCSPRGDPAGFVRIQDERTLLIPDRRGNNRLDSLRNLMEDPRISLLFLIPGIDRTLRVNGRATLVTNLALRESFQVQGKLPATVIVVNVERVYTQCPKAFIRSDFWNPAARVEPSCLPSSGTIMQSIKRDFDGKAYDAGYEQHVKKTIY